MSDKSHHPHDPAHPPPEQPSFPPQSLESGNFGASTYERPGTPLPPQEGYPEYGGYTSSQQPFYPSADRPSRPVTVIIGCIMAWVGSAVGILIGALFLSITEDSALFDDVDLDVNRADAVDVLNLTGAFLLGWCLIVVVMAFLAFRGAKWAAITLLVMAGIMIALTLVTIVSGGGGQGVIGLLWSLASAALIYLNRPAKEWFAAKAEAKRLRTG
jgi:hypothetical protein